MNKILQGDSWQLAKELPDESVDCVVTSPPYWGLRDYGVEGQAGLEEHPQQWIDKMVELCELIRPKLKKSSVMFWNIGETYWGSSGHFDSKNPHARPQGSLINHSKKESNWLQPKQLLGLPWRFAIAMQDKGWILRNAVIWDKPNHMPSSVKDRFSNGYEYVFMFVKSKRYWFDLDAVRVPHETDASNILRDKSIEPFNNSYPNGHFSKGLRPEGHSAGKNCGDVWRITTRPHPFAHFAVFPEELAERCIKAGCPKEGVVLDPFMGSGTVAVVAKRLNRQYVGFELNEKYIQIAERRLSGVTDWKTVKDIETGKQKVLNGTTTGY